MFCIKLLLIAIFLMAAPTTAQELVEIDDFVAGTVGFEESYQVSVGGMETPLDSHNFVETDGMRLGTEVFSSVTTEGRRVIAADRQGVVEFNLHQAMIPESFTSDNFVARLFVYDGQLSSLATHVEFDIFEMESSSRDGQITELDYFNILGSPLNSEVIVDGIMDPYGYDITDIIRRDLFEGIMEHQYLGFLFVPSQGTGEGRVTFEGDLAYLSLIPVDTTDTDSTASPDSDHSDADTADTGDVVEEDSDSATDTDGGVAISDPDVSCGCRVTGTLRRRSILRLLF